MKALTLCQPWASLIAWGEKQYETRSWSTDYRGLLAIHASKRPSDYGVMMNTLYAGEMARKRVRHFNNLPVGSGAVRRGSRGGGDHGQPEGDDQ